MKKEPCVDGTDGGSEGERSGKPISRSLCTRQKSKTCAGSKSELVLEGGTKAMRMCMCICMICVICMCERDVVGLRAVARTDTQWKGGRWRCYEELQLNFGRPRDSEGVMCVKRACVCVRKGGSSGAG